MRKFISIVTFGWIVIVTIHPQFLEPFITTVNRFISDLFADLFPYLRVNLDLNQLAYLFFWFSLLQEVYYRQGALHLKGLRLKRYGFSNETKAMNLDTTSRAGERVLVGDYLADICLIERRFNSWVLIWLATGFWLLPSILLVIVIGKLEYGLLFVLPAILSYAVLLKGRLTVFSSDGGSESIVTSKTTATQLTEAICRFHPNEFIRVSLSDLFFEEEVHFHASQITGVIQISKFPWGWFFLFLITALGAISSLFISPPIITLLALLIPVFLLIIVIARALQKKVIVKLVGGLYYSLGNHSSTQEILLHVAPFKNQVSPSRYEPEVRQTSVQAGIPTAPNLANPG